MKVSNSPHASNFHCAISNTKYILLCISVCGIFLSCLDNPPNKPHPAAPIGITLTGLPKTVAGQAAGVLLLTVTVENDTVLFRQYRFTDEIIDTIEVPVTFEAQFFASLRNSAGTEIYRGAAARGISQEDYNFIEINMRLIADAPVITRAGTQSTVTLGQLYTDLVKVSIPGGVMNSVTFTARPPGMTISGNSIAWAPSDTGSYTLTAVVTDEFGQLDSVTWDLVVVDPLSPMANQAPVFLTSIADFPDTVYIGQSYSLTAAAQDNDDTLLLYETIDTVPGLYYFGGYISFIPAHDQAGIETAVFRVSDLRGGADSLAWTFRVVWQVNLDSGLVAYYPFNGNADDESGKGNDGSVNNAILVKDRFGNSASAFYFNGVNSYIDLGNKFQGGHEFTLHAWVRFDYLNDFNVICEKNQTIGFSLKRNGNGVAQLNSNRGSGTDWGPGVAASDSLVSGRWYNLITVFSDSNISLYIDGILAAAGVDINQIDTTAKNMVIGSDQVMHSYYFSGEIDDIRVYDRAINPWEIESLYNVGGWTVEPISSQTGLYLMAYYPFNGNADDESGNRYKGQVEGAILTEDRFGNPNGAYLFDGINDFINTSVAVPGPGINIYIIHTDCIAFQADDDIYESSIVLAKGTWNLITYVLDAKNNRFYIYLNDLLAVDSIYNGQLTRTFSVWISWTGASGAFSRIMSRWWGYSTLHFGSGNDGGEDIHFFNGSMDDIRMYNFALNSAAIDSLYHLSGWNGDTIVLETVTDSRDGQTYKKVTIGTQTWMAENLNFTPATGSSWCYNDSSQNCDTYGRLYDWNTAVADDHGNGWDICPVGWHLPSDEDWAGLERFIGIPESEIYTNGWRGIDHGSMLKSASWNGTDYYQFNALPGGQRNASGVFQGLYIRSAFWASNEASATHSRSRGLIADSSTFSRASHNKGYGRSIRCIEGISAVDSIFADWSYYMDLVLNTSATGANIQGDIEKFPVLVRLSPSVIDLTQSTADGRDIRFWSLSGGRLSYEIEYWNQASNEASIWVLVPVIYANNSTQRIRMYWGNSSSLPNNQPEEVFSNNNGFQAVWHLSNLSDATVNQNNLVKKSINEPVGSPGIVGNAMHFDGVDDSLLCGNDTSLQITGNLTVSFWMNSESDTQTFPSILQFDRTVGSGYWFILNGTTLLWETNINSVFYASIIDMPTEETNSWQYITGTYNLEKWISYKNGSQKDTISLSTNLSKYSNSCVIGATFYESYDNFLGTLDEIRISNSARSADWIKLCYENQKPNQTLIEFSSVQK